MSRHDPAVCGVCYVVRVRRLRRLGLAVKLCRQLGDCGTAGAPLLLAVESATPAQVEQLNALSSLREAS